MAITGACGGKETGTVVIDVIAPNGCGIKTDKRLRKLVITAEDVADQEKLYKIAGLISIASHSILAPETDKRRQVQMSDKEKALRIYDLLREAHKIINQIWSEFPDLISNGTPLPEPYNGWENAVDAVDNTTYLAERYFVRESQER